MRYRISTGSITPRISGGLSKKHMAELTPVLAALKADNLSPVLCAALRVLLYSCIMLFAGNPATLPHQPASAPAVVVHAAAVQSERCCLPSLLAACVTCCLAFFRHFTPKLLPLPPLLLELLLPPSRSISAKRARHHSVNKRLISPLSLLLKLATNAATKLARRR